jgi:hypothetical protein
MRDDEPMKRRGLLLVRKLKAEGTPAKEHIFLGWILNTCLLLILLPVDKYETWSSDIQVIVLTEQTTYEELKSTLGWLNHIGYIIPLVHHFLNWLRLWIRKQWHKNQQLLLNNEEIEDLNLWHFFLASPRHGVSLNQVTTHKPSTMCWSDLCPFGIGGFLLSG